MKTGKQRNSKVDYYPIKNDKDLHKLIHELLFELLDTYNKKHSKLYHENKAGKGEAKEIEKAQ